MGRGAEMSTQADRLSAAVAGRYRIERELGAGGMATVYLAEDLKHDRKVAIKVLKPELAAVRVDGSAAVEPIRTRRYHQHITDWSLDGPWMLVDVATPDHGFDIQAIRIDGKGDDIDLAPARGNQGYGKFSPDGRWVAYSSDESGKWEVYVVSFPDPRTRRQVSVNGGWFPSWSRQSGELFYFQDTTMMVSRVSTAGDFQRSAPVPAFARNVSANTGTTRDGQRFVVASQNPAAPARELNVVVGWDAVVRAKGKQ